MNWIILIIAGFFESCFAFCLGKIKYVALTICQCVSLFICLFIEKFA